MVPFVFEITKKLHHFFLPFPSSNLPPQIPLLLLKVTASFVIVIMCICVYI